MNKGYFHSSGTLPIEMYPDRFHVQDFVFTVGEEETPWVITSFTWAFVLKANKGNNDNLLFLTLNNGLSFPIYTTNRLRARFEAATLKAIGEGEYFWMLVKTDTNEPILKGECKLTFDPEAPTSEGADVTVNIVNNTVQVSVQALLTGNTSSGGGSSLINHPIASGVPSGATLGARYYLTGSPGVILGEAVAEGTIMEARIANAAVRADWYFNFGGT